MGRSGGDVVSRRKQRRAVQRAGATARACSPRPAQSIVPEFSRSLRLMVAEMASK